MHDGAEEEQEEGQSLIGEDENDERTAAVVVAVQQLTTGFAALSIGSLAYVSNPSLLIP